MERQGRLLFVLLLLAGLSTFALAAIGEKNFCKLPYDSCGVCGGDGSSCTQAGCDNVLGSNVTLDACGVCGGDNSTCLGCDGIPNSGVTEDHCNVCGGTNDCLGCDGWPYSNKVYDECGQCGGDGSSCMGCDGVPNSGLQFDTCGVCGGNDACVVEQTSRRHTRLVLLSLIPPAIFLAYFYRLYDVRRWFGQSKDPKMSQ